MRIVSNAGTDHVVDLMRPWLREGHRIESLPEGDVEFLRESSCRSLDVSAP